MENTQMELLVEGAEYKDIAQTAKTLGIPHVGVKKNVLFDLVNAKIAKVNNGEVSVELPEPKAAVEETPEVTEGQTTNEEVTEGTVVSPAEAKARKSAGKQKERAVRQAAKKWFEEEGANPYSEGDVVLITGGKDLQGRKLQVIEPSAKKDMVKGKLIHPVTGGLQNTVIAISFDRIELVQSGDSIAQDEPQEVENNIEEVTTPESVENITEGSEEEVTIPQLEVEENEEEKEAK